MPSAEYDAVVVGSGPNGLAAAITIAREGHSVLVVEAAGRPGGGTRTSELTAPGFRHDVCSAIHPMGAASPFFSGLPLSEHGLRWVHPDLSLAHPFDDGSAAELHLTIDETVAANGEGESWRRMFQPLVDRWPALSDQLLGPPLRAPKHPWPFLQFGLRSLPPVSVFSDRLLRGPRASALFAGIAAHANTSLHRPLSAPAGLVLVAAGHVAGWPLARGGSEAIADALVAHLRELGGKIEVNREVTSIDDLPRSRAVLFDTTPSQLLRIAGHRLPGHTRWRYRRFRRGAGSFKLDYALDGPMPWTAEACRRAGTVHLGGPASEVVDAEREVWRGRIPERPLVLVAQQSLFDATRAPAGKHTLWAYCHVPNGSPVDMAPAIEAQFDRFAPGWRDLVIARTDTPPAGLQEYDANYLGGDIAGGAADGLQLLFRPVIAVDPYRTPTEGIYLCSSSTPPGGGVHGVCGWWAGRSALEQLAA